MSTNRQPKGVPVGGQFAADPHAEPEVDLSFDPCARATNVASEAIWEHLQPVFQDMRTSSGDDSRLTAARWRNGAEAAAAAIGKQVTAPAPVLNGFTAAEVEDYLAREQHERQCGCDLVDDICYTKEYGEHWRYRLGVPDVEGIFDTMQEMAAARDAKAAAEENA